MKRGLKNAHRYLRGKYNQDPDEELCFRHGDKRIIARLPRKDDEQLTKALEKLPRYLESLTGKERYIVYDENEQQWHKLGRL